MNTWTIQAGYPVIHVNIISDNLIELKQERFYKDSSQKKENE